MILHACVYDGTHRNIHIIGAKVLQQINHLVALGPEIIFGKGAIVSDANALATGTILRRNMVEPGGFAKGACLCDAEAR